MPTETLQSNLAEAHNRKIESSILRYCLMTSAPKYAVQLKGPWGSGKTWFTNKLKNELKKQQKEVLYASFFGVSSTKDITAQLFAQMHPIIGSEAARKTGVFVKHLLKATLKIDLNGDGKDDGSLQLSIPDIDKWNATNGTVLIFDDLERSRLSIDECLGFINQFIEHDDYRVVVVANEEVESIKEAGFLSIREKVIGRTFEIQPNHFKAIEAFLEDIKARDAHQITIQHKQTLITAFERSQHRNLRLLRQAVLDFADLWDDIKNHIPLGKNEQFIENLVNETATLSIEHRYGNWTPDDILLLEITNWDVYLGTEETGQVDSAKSKSNLALKRHGFDSGKTFAISCSAYAEFFRAGSLNTESAVQATETSPYFMTDETASWKRLWHVHSLDNETFTEFSEKTIEDLKQSKFETLPEFIHIAALLMFLSVKNLINIPQDELLSLSEKSLIAAIRAKRITPPNSYSFNHLKEDASAFGLGFTNSTSPEYKELIERIGSIITIERAAWVNSMIEAWMLKLERDTKAWAKELKRTPPTDGKFVDDPVLANIDSLNFIKILARLEPENRRLVIQTLESRYEQINIYSKWLRKEIIFLEGSLEAIEKLNKELEKENKVFTKYIISTLIEPKLKTWIERIKNTGFHE